MSWNSSFIERSDTTPIGSFSVNENCFIRKQHKCGKVFAASKSCFIACPTDDDLNPMLELISEKLTKVGIEPIIAVKERAYGQDIFCTKICGKIIEARFCIVILDDTLKDGHNLPNPNVYYEYGLMTSLRKHIIPLQKDGFLLSFNIQSYDTIKYNAKNLGLEIDRGIRDAIRLTETKDKQAEKESLLPQKRIMHRLEVAGFKIRGKDWYLAEVIDDTDFKGFGQYDKRFYLYLGKIDTPQEFIPYLEELDIVLFRTEEKSQELSEIIAGDEERMASIKREKATQDSYLNEEKLIYMPYESQIETLKNDIDRNKDIFHLMSKIYIGFIINPNLNSDEFIRNTEEIVKKYQRYQLAFSRGNEIAFGDIILSFAERGH